MRLAATLLLAALPAYGASAPDWQQCRDIAPDNARLACYDQLAGAAVATAPAPAPAPTTDTASAEQRFGAEQLPGASSTDAQVPALHSRIPGALQGWEPKSRFTLENGQVWQNLGERPAYFQVRDAAVTIEKSAVGGYWLKLDALNLQTRVRRIR